MIIRKIDILDRLVDFDLVEFELETEELAEYGRESRKDDHFGDIVDPWIDAKTAYLEGTLYFLWSLIKF